MESWKKTHRHKFSRIELVIKVGESHYQILRCLDCGEGLKLEKIVGRPYLFIEKYPDRFIELKVK